MLPTLRTAFLLIMLLSSKWIAAEVIHNGSASWRLTAVPDWVKDEDIAEAAVTPSQGVRLLQSDTQINWLPAQPVQYRRHAMQVVTSSGIDNAAKYQIEFEPNYQQLEIHRLRVKRNGQWSDRLQGKPVELLRRETNLESSQYDGRITASINLPDVRTGDIVEMAWSIHGSNPIFGEQRSARLYLTAGGAYGGRLLRLLAPANAPLQYKLIGPQRAAVEDRSHKGVRELLLRPQQKEAFVFEDMAPPQLAQASFLHVTTIKDWEQVIRWGRSLFDSAPPSSAEFAAKVTELKAIADPAARVMAALNFVQEDIRYFGVEININSHKPYTPDQVIGQRYGDCKDKTQLLYWLLRASGIETSTPALVSVYGGVKLSDALPSPDVFDHVILRLQLNGKTWWLDGTVSGQGDNLATLGSFRYGQVLPLDGSSRGPVEATTTRAAGGRAIFSERMQVKDMSGAAELMIDNEFQLEEAERMRRRVAETGLEELQRQWLEEARKRYPEAETIGSLQLEDDPQNNILHLREHYALKEAFKFADGTLRFTIDGSSMSGYLPRPQVNNRRYALLLPRVEEVLYNYELQGDFVARTLSAPSNSSTRQDDAHMRLTVEKAMQPGTVRVQMKLQMLAEEVDPAAMPRYLKTTQAILADSSLTYSYGVVVDNTTGYTELEQQLRKQHAKLQPESWRNILVASTVQATRLQEILDRQRPTEPIRAAVASRLAWHLINIGEPEKAIQLTSLFEKQPEHTQDLDAWLALVNLLKGQAANGWRNFQSFQQNRTEAMGWYDTCTGVLLALFQGNFAEAQQLLIKYPATDTNQRAEAMRWMAVILRLQYGTDQATSQWPDNWHNADEDLTTAQLMTRSDAQLKNLAELYNEVAPNKATRLWFALALQARRQGQNVQASDFLQQILNLKVGALHDYNIARSYKARWSKERSTPRSGF